MRNLSFWKFLSFFHSPERKEEAGHVNIKRAKNPSRGTTHALREKKKYWSRRSSGGGNDNLLQYSCLKNPMDRGIWRATAQRVAKSQAWLSKQIYFRVFLRFPMNGYFGCLLFFYTFKKCCGGHLSNMPLLFSHSVVSGFYVISIDCSPPSSSVHAVFSSLELLECVAISFSRGSSWTSNQTCISYIGKWILYDWATRDPKESYAQMQDLF